eukprot:6205766-Amphidinium_carterae.1
MTLSPPHRLASAMYMSCFERNIELQQDPMLSKDLSRLHNLHLKAKELHRVTNVQLQAQQAPTYLVVWVLQTFTVVFKACC